MRRRLNGSRPAAPSTGWRWCNETGLTERGGVIFRGAESGRCLLNSPVGFSSSITGCRPGISWKPTPPIDIHNLLTRPPWLHEMIFSRCTERSLTNTLIGTGIHEDYCSAAGDVAQLVTGLGTCVQLCKVLLATFCWWLSQLNCQTAGSLYLFHKGKLVVEHKVDICTRKHTHTLLSIISRWYSFYASKCCCLVSPAVVILWLFKCPGPVFSAVSILYCNGRCMQLCAWWILVTNVGNSFTSCLASWPNSGLNYCSFDTACRKWLDLSKLWTGKDSLVSQL